MKEISHKIPQFYDAIYMKYSEEANLERQKDQCLPEARRNEEMGKGMGMIAKRHGVHFQGNKNVLKLIVVMVANYEYT